MDNVHEVMESLLNTMELLKKIEKDIRNTPPENMTREQEAKLDALLDIINDVVIPDVHFLPAYQLIGEA
jgi:hypothetical protein